MLEQLTELGERYLGIKVMMDMEPKIELIPLREYDPKTRSNRILLLTVKQVRQVLG